MPKKQPTEDNDSRSTYERVQDFVATLRDDIRIPAEVIANAVETEAALLRQQMKDESAFFFAVADAVNAARKAGVAQRKIGRTLGDAAARRG